VWEMDGMGWWVDRVCAEAGLGLSRRERKSAKCFSLKFSIIFYSFHGLCTLFLLAWCMCVELPGRVAPHRDQPVLSLSIITSVTLRCCSLTIQFHLLISTRETRVNLIVAFGDNWKSDGLHYKTITEQRYLTIRFGWIGWN